MNNQPLVSTEAGTQIKHSLDSRLRGNELISRTLVSVYERQ
jgi:hypothetical protein